MQTTKLRKDIQIYIYIFTFVSQWIAIVTREYTRSIVQRKDLYPIFILENYAEMTAASSISVMNLNKSLDPAAQHVLQV